MTCNAGNVGSALTKEKISQIMFAIPQQIYSVVPQTKLNLLHQCF